MGVALYMSLAGDVCSVGRIGAVVVCCIGWLQVVRVFAVAVGGVVAGLQVVLGFVMQYAPIFDLPSATGWTAANNNLNNHCDNTLNKGTCRSI